MKVTYLVCEELLFGEARIRHSFHYDVLIGGFRLGVNNTKTRMLAKCSSHTQLLSYTPHFYLFYFHHLSIWLWVKNPGTLGYLRYPKMTGPWIFISPNMARIGFDPSQYYSTPHSHHGSSQVVPLSSNVIHKPTSTIDLSYTS